MSIYNNQYRVICSRDAFSGETFIDIVPASYAIHQEILDIRQTKNPRVQDFAGVINLIDQGDGKEPIVNFEALKTHFLYSEYECFDEKIYPQLEKDICDKFREMKNKKQKTTIEKSEFVGQYTEAMATNLTNEHPQTYIGETIKKEQDKQNRREKLEKFKRFRDSIDHHDPVVLMAWRQKIDSGR